MSSQNTFFQLCLAAGAAESPGPGEALKATPAAPPPGGQRQEPCPPACGELGPEPGPAPAPRPAAAAAEVAAASAGLEVEGSASGPTPCAAAPAVDDLAPPPASPPASPCADMAVAAAASAAGLKDVVPAPAPATAVPAAPPAAAQSPAEPTAMETAPPAAAPTPAEPAVAQAAAPGPAEPPAAPTPAPVPEAACEAAGPSGEASAAGELPDGSDSLAMLLHLREAIPASVLEAYRLPYRVDEEERAAAQARLAVFRAEVQRIIRTREVAAKPDMRANKNLRASHPEWPSWQQRHGHMPGVELGQVLMGRGETEALGVTSNYLRGISRIGSEPAYAVCLSGGYEDDGDAGDWCFYTGSGGGAGSDQEWAGDNEALRQAHLRALPVRVLRGSKGDGGREYTYDGLYLIMDSRRVVGKQGSLVCRFTLVGIPGHYQASKRVEFGALTSGFKRRVMLAGPDPAPPKPRAAAVAAAAASAAAEESRPAKKKARKSGTPAPAAPPVRGPPPSPVQGKAWLAAVRARRGFLCEDISGGQEQVKIPAFNEIDGAPLPGDVEYIRSSRLASEAAAAVTAAALAVMPAPGWCGLQQGMRQEAYTPAGVMKMTEPLGYWECGPGCASPACAGNRVASGGITLPLEVHRLGAAKGWGVRCAADIPVGSFVSCYEGEVVCDREAEARRGVDAYLMDLDHFLQQYLDTTASRAERMALPPLPWPAAEDAEHLTIDAARAGNVSRYINHSCAPNLVLQPVLRQGDSGLSYGMALVALQHIPAGTELSYDYKYIAGSVPGVEMACLCGAEACRKRLL